MPEGYEIDDPRPIAAEAPYTFFLPSEARLAALAPGDMVQLTFRAIPQSDKWDAERMWVLIEAVEGERLFGSLQTEPCDIPSLQVGADLAFERWQVIDIDEDEARPEKPQETYPRDYWERCLVDQCVLDDNLPVHYLYREAPEPFDEEDRYPDSGWRIRGDYRSLTEAEIDARQTSYIALGKVLNVDDSWLHLIDAPVGSAFIRDWETGEFVPYS